MRGESGDDAMAVRPPWVKGRLGFYLCLVAPALTLYAAVIDYFLHPVLMPRLGTAICIAAVVAGLYSLVRLVAVLDSPPRTYWPIWLLLLVSNWLCFEIGTRLIVILD